VTEDELLEEDEKEVVGLYRVAEDMFFGSRQENVCFWTAAHALSVLSSSGWCLRGKRLLLPFSSLAELRLKMVAMGFLGNFLERT